MGYQRRDAEQCNYRQGGPWYKLVGPALQKAKDEFYNALDERRQAKRARSTKQAVAVVQPETVESEGDIDFEGYAPNWNRCHQATQVVDAIKLTVYGQSTGYACEHTVSKSSKLHAVYGRTANDLGCQPAEITLSWRDPSNAYRKCQPDETLSGTDMEPGGNNALWCTQSHTVNNRDNGGGGSSRTTSLNYATHVPNL
jgi:hypothetical protein